MNDAWDATLDWLTFKAVGLFVWSAELYRYGRDH